MSLPRVEPAPPIAELSMPWDEPVDDPVAAVAAARASLGDTFLVDSGGIRHLFLFSPTGVAAFYALREEEASKGVADWQMLRRKLPDELFLGRRTLPHELFGRDDAATYLDALDASLDVALDELGPSGALEVFAFTRRLAHRLALASWVGEPPAAGERFDALVQALDVLDASAAFVHPGDMADVAASGKAAELAALAELEELVAPNVRRVDAGTAPPAPAFGEIVRRWQGLDEPERTVGIARDAVLVHLGAMSNLFAALGWMLVDLLLHPQVWDAAAADPALLERCALESTRLAQRSIMLRATLRPVVVDDERGPLAVEPGVVIATLLPLTNSTAGPGLDGYDPRRWDRRRLRGGPATKELVTTFGHGSHTCPAQPFSLAAMTRTASRLLAGYDLHPRFDAAEPLPGQIGGVARSARPCLVGFRRR